MPSNSTPARKAYDKLAAVYDRRWGRYVQATLRTVAESLSLRGRERILDLPCGTGELQRRLLSRWADLRMVGADVSREMLRRAAAKQLGPAVTWVQADAGRLPFADGSFDCVTCVNSFHYFRSPQDCLHELRRVLAKEGTLVLVDWCDDYVSCKLCSLWLRWTDPAFYRTYSLRACRSLLERSGFEVTAAKRFRISWLWGLMHFACRRIE